MNLPLEVLSGAVPDNVFDVFERCTTSTTLEQFTVWYTAEGVPPKVESPVDIVTAADAWTWLNTMLGLHPCRVGRFWFANTLQRSRWEQLHVIEKHYTDDMIESHLLPLIHKSGGSGKRVSLRVLDWLVTNFSKKNRIIYTITLDSGKTVPFNLYLQYKASLNRYKRHVFDPFRRHKRVYFVFKNQMYSTTVGQLNFMHWAFQHHIIDYAQSRMAEIEADMTFCIRENQRDKETFKKRGTKRSRKPLCKITPRKCFVYTMEENVGFVQCPVKKNEVDDAE